MDRKNEGANSNYKHNWSEHLEENISFITDSNDIWLK